MGDIMGENREKLGFYSISKYRNELFAFSIISIIIFHYIDDFLDATTKTGISILPADCYANIISSIGVEIFVLLSGLGLYFSFKRNSDIKEFYVKRFLRISVPYCLFGCVAWLIITLIREEGFFYYIYNFSLMSFWNSGNVMLWYIAFILIMYLAFPLIFLIINSKHSGRNTFITLAVIYLILFSCEINSSSIFSDVEIALWRIPDFIIGTYLGKLVYEKRQFKTYHYVFFVVAFVHRFIFYILSFFVNGEESANPLNLILDFFNKYSRFFSGFYALGLVFVLVAIFRLLNSKLISKISTPISKVTLELYMTHVTIRNISRTLNLPIDEFWYFLTYVLISVVITIILNVVSNKIIYRINHNPKHMNCSDR